MAATRVSLALAFLMGVAPKQAPAPVEMLLAEVLFAPRPGWPRRWHPVAES